MLSAISSSAITLVGGTSAIALNVLQLRRPVCKSLVYYVQVPGTYIMHISREDGVHSSDVHFASGSWCSALCASWRSVRAGSAHDVCSWCVVFE